MSFRKLPSTHRRTQQDPKDFHSAIDKSLSSRYHLQNTIGRGNYAFTYKIMNKRTRLQFCLKKIHDAFYCHTDAKNVFREVLVMDAIRKSPIGTKRTKAGGKIATGIIYFRDALMNRRDVYLVMPLFACDLRAGMMILESSDQREWIGFQIAWMLRELHDGARCMHRDLCPENVLLDEKCNVTLGDLGLVRDCDRKKAKEMPADEPEEHDSWEEEHQDDPETPFPRPQVPRTDYVGHLYYRAPEIICGNVYYTEKVDIWAAGCIIAELYVGTIFTGKNSVDLLKNILLFTGIPDVESIQTLQSPFAQALIDKALNETPNFREKSIEFRHSLLSQLPPKIVDVVQECLQFDADKRPSAAQLMTHPAFVECTPFDPHDPTLPSPQLSRVRFPHNIDQMEVDEFRALIHDTISSLSEASVSPSKRGLPSR